MDFCDTTLDMMIERATEKLLEEQTMPTDETTLKLAAKDLEFAIDELDHAADWVWTGMEELKDCVEYDRVASIMQEMESILKDLKAMQKAWEKGEPR